MNVDMAYHHKQISGLYGNRQCKVSPINVKLYLKRVELF